MTTEQTLDQTVTPVDMDALLDGTLDDLADIPEFRPWPNGAHKAKIVWDLAKTIDGVYKVEGQESSGLKRFIGLDAVAIETVELPAGSTDKPLEVGSKANWLFDLTTERGQGSFKAIMASLAEHYGAKSPRELMTDSMNAEVVIFVKQWTAKKGNSAGKTFANIDNLMVV